MNKNALKTKMRMKYFISFALYSFVLISTQTVLAEAAEVFICKVTKSTTTYKNNKGFNQVNDSCYGDDCIPESMAFDKDELQQSPSSFYRHGQPRCKPSTVNEVIPRLSCERTDDLEISRIDGSFKYIGRESGETEFARTTKIEEQSGICTLKKMNTKF